MTRYLHYFLAGLAPISSGCAMLFPGAENNAPTAIIEADSQSRVGSPVVFNGSRSDDADGTIEIYQWDFGDGASAEGPIVGYSFQNSGEFVVTLVVTDDQGSTATATFSISIEPELFLLRTHVAPPDAGSIALDPPGGAYEEGTIVTLTAQPAEGYAFMAFEGDAVATGVQIQLTMDADKEVTARFAPLLTLSVAIEPEAGGIVTLDPPGGTYAPGTSVALTASPLPGFTFHAFLVDEGILSTQPRATIIVTENVTVIARFYSGDAAIFQLDVEVSPAGAGAVTLDPPGGAYVEGTSVTLAATAFSGFVFDAFAVDQEVIATDPNLSVVMTEDLVVNARFRSDDSSPVFALNLAVSPPGSGSISANPTGGVYAPGTVVTLTASQSAGYRFLRYFGDATATNPVTTVTMTGPKSVVAEFEWVPAQGNPGNILVSGFLGANVREFDRFDGRDLGEVVSGGAGGISFAGGVAVSPDGALLVVDVGVLTDTRVLRFDATGIFSGEFISGPGPTGFLTIRFSPQGSVFVPDSSNDSVSEYDGTSGQFIRTVVGPNGGGLSNPVGLVFGPEDNVFVASKGNDRILEFDASTGAFISSLDLAGSGFTIPVDLIIGPDGNLFVSVSGDDSVVRVDFQSPTPSAFVMSGTGGLDSPAGLAFHPDTGNLLVVSQGTNEVLEFDGETGAFVGVFAEGVDGESLFFVAVRPH